MVTILAAGEGSRLRPLTANRPKCLIEFGGRPLIVRIINNLVDLGVREVTIVIRYLSDRIVEALGDGADFGCRLTYVRQAAPASAESALTSVLGNSDADRFVFLCCDDLLSKQEVRELLSVDTEVRSLGRVAHDSTAPRLHLEEDLAVATSHDPSDPVMTYNMSTPRGVLEAFESALDPCRPTPLSAFILSSDGLPALRIQLTTSPEINTLEDVKRVRSALNDTSHPYRKL